MNEKNTGGPELEIILKCGGSALVSASSAWLVIGGLWRVGTNGYVYKVGARKKGVQCLLHRIVTNADKGTDVHHKNGVKTDCRIENLETHSPSDHQKHHSHLVIDRNKASRIHDEYGVCISCGVRYLKNPDHRSRQKYCGQQCAKSDLKNAMERNRNANR